MNLKLLKAHMILIGIDSKKFAKLQKWSMSTFYRKLSGKAQFTRQEIGNCISVLELKPEDIVDIFFADYMSYRTNNIMKKASK